MSSQDKIVPDNIKVILQKYYDGLSSIDEEKLLKDYFSVNDSDPSRIPDQQLFTFLNQKNDSFISNEKLWKGIQKNENKKQKQVRIIKFFYSAAASIIIIFSLSLWYLLYEPTKTNIVADTYSNPEEAYKVARKYLGFVSSNLSNAYTEIKSIEKLEIPSEVMQSFNKINESFDQLSQFNKLRESTIKMEKISAISDYINITDESQTIK
ncbi:MAG: hypothetical protein AB9846_12040 [Tenuifilaceae bacterium]